MTSLPSCCVTKSQSADSFKQGRRGWWKELNEVKVKWAFSQKDVKIQERRLAKMNEFLTGINWSMIVYNWKRMDVTTRRN